MQLRRQPLIYPPISPVYLPVMKRDTTVQIHFIDSIHQIDAAQWNQLCPPDYPFVRHEFLAALEDSGCTNATTGWQVQHLLIFAEAQLLAIMPGYVKTHSYGEYGALY